MGKKIITADSRGQGARGLFIATARARDQEMEERIRRHREERGDEWETVEESIDVVNLIRRRQGIYSVILVDCLTLWLTCLMCKAPQCVEGYFAGLRDTLMETETPVIMVSNEVGLGIVPVSADGRRFRDHAGRMHQEIARVCDRVIFTVAGIPMFVKGEDIA